MLIVFYKSEDRFRNHFAFHSVTVLCVVQCESVHVFNGLVDHNLAADGENDISCEWGVVIPCNPLPQHDTRPTVGSH